jgi:hypothetical protein
MILLPQSMNIRMITVGGVSGRHKKKLILDLKAQYAIS